MLGESRPGGHHIDPEGLSRDDYSEHQTAGPRYADRTDHSEAAYRESPGAVLGEGLGNSAHMMRPGCWRKENLRVHLAPDAGDTGRTVRGEEAVDKEGLEGDLVAVRNEILHSPDEGYMLRVEAGYEIIPEVGEEEEEEGGSA